MGIAGLNLATVTDCETFSQKKVEGLHFEFQMYRYLNMVPNSAGTVIQLLSCLFVSLVPLYRISKLFYKFSSLNHVNITIIHIKVP